MAVGSETMTMALEMDSTMFQGLSRMVARVTTKKYTACRSQAEARSQRHDRRRHATAARQATRNGRLLRNHCGVCVALTAAPSLSLG